MVRCGQNRSEMKYETDCVNARDAINRLERAEERARRAELEAQSERKRLALRRTQEAAAAARRRAQEEQRRREEAEYLGIFEDGTATTDGAPAPQPGNTTAAVPTTGNAPTAEVIPPESAPAPVEEALPAPSDDVPPVQNDEPAPDASDLEAVREELRRRQQSTDQN